MYKASLDLGKINNSLHVKFCLIIENDDNGKNNFNNHLVNKFTVDGNKYIRISPHPYIVLDISNKETKKEGWTSNLSVSMNKLSLFLFIKSLSNLINNFKAVRKLFFYDADKRLKVSQEEAQKTAETIQCGNKRVLLMPCVVPDEEKEDITYEGCMLCINSFDNFCYVTFTEMEYLLYVLNHIDMDDMTLPLINTVIASNGVSAKEYKPAPVSYVETNEENERDKVPYIKIEEPNAIPKI